MVSKDNEFNKLKKRIGNNIKIIREFHKISQERLCEYINKSQSTLSKYENGESLIGLNTLFEICEYFTVPIHDILKKDFSIEYLIEQREDQKQKILSSPHNYLTKISELYLYYMSTSYDNRILEVPLIFVEKEKGGYISFLFEDKHNSPDKQLYEGKLVIEFQHAYFYIENKNRGERGLIITYYYPQKNKQEFLGLIGLMISLAHGYEQCPCAQKCIISSKKLNTNSSILLDFLKLNITDHKNTNIEYINLLHKYSDKLFYDWLKKK